jgi:N6-adenosine-specific RNA methylase IME4
VIISAPQWFPPRRSRDPHPAPARSAASPQCRNIGRFARPAAPRSISAAGSRAITVSPPKNPRTRTKRAAVDCASGGREHTRMSSSPRPKHYKVIYADPPWTFATYSRKGKGRSAEAYYDCMSLAEIQALPVTDWAAEDCVLLLWATDPLLESAFELIRAWGFTYKTVGFYWAKLKRPELLFTDGSFFTGMGFWTRANPEPCLLATRGKPHRRRADVRKLIVSPRREHSRNQTRPMSASRLSAKGLIWKCSPASLARAGIAGGMRVILRVRANAGGARIAIPTRPRRPTSCRFQERCSGDQARVPP